MTDTNKQAPYMGYNVFTKSIETFADTLVPSGPIDRRILTELSGGDYSALISGLKFFDLTDDQRKPTAKYRELVGLWKEPAKFKERLQKILLEGYAPIVGDLDLKRGTAVELEKAFKDYGVGPGQMLMKSIRFFIKAMSESGVLFSPYMTARKPRSPNITSKKGSVTRTKFAQRREEEQDHGGNAKETQVPAGFERLPLPGMPNSFIQYPANLTEAQCQLFEAMVGVLQTSIKARTGGKEKQP